MSVRSRVQRLRRLTAGELAWRGRSLGHRVVDRATGSVRPPSWRRETLARRLRPGGELGDALVSLSDRRFDEAHRRLAAHVQHRPQRGLLHPRLRVPLRARVLAEHPAAIDNARARADRLVAGEYDVLGYRNLRFGDAGAIDWHLDPVAGRRAPNAFWADVPFLAPSSGDHKVIWELNRHQHWLALGRAWWLSGESRYRARVLQELASWMAANPPLTGVNWASTLELAFRCLSWTWTIELFADDATEDDQPWLVDLLMALDAQLRHIERNLSWYFSPNTHLLGEALALYVCSLSWPELKDAERWSTIGGDILVGEIGRQVLADGFHAERSPHYHRYALEFYLLALSSARLSRDDQREAAFAAAADRMATALRRITDAGGRVPLIGDDDGGELFPFDDHRPDDVRPALAWAASMLGQPGLAIGSPPEATLWLTAAFDDTDARRVATRVAADAHEHELPLDGSAALSSSGYHVSRRDDAVLVFDAGPHGFLNGGHAHADALAVTLSIGTERLFVDCGTATYTMNPALRDRLRASQLHNTLTLDDRSQSLPAGPFHWARTAGARIERIVIGTGFDLFHASTDAYDPVRHERLVFATGGGTWVIADRVTGIDRHRASVHWHVDPDWSVRPDGHGATMLTHPAGVEARVAITDAVVDVFQGDAATGLGWIAPIYGRLVPATTLRGTADRPLPIWILTSVDVGAPGATRGRTTALEVLCSDARGTASGVLTRRDGHVIVTVFRVGSGRETLSFDLDPRGRSAITTDAVALHARVSDTGLLERVCLVDATVCRFDGVRPVTITCGTPLVDLDVQFERNAAPRVATTGDRDAVSIAVDTPTRTAPPAPSPRLAPPVLHQ